MAAQRRVLLVRNERGSENPQVDSTVADLIRSGLSSIPAIIAAVSSLRNGAEQRRVKQELKVTNGHVQRAIQTIKSRARVRRVLGPKVQPRRAGVFREPR